MSHALRAHDEKAGNHMVSQQWNVLSASDATGQGANLRQQAGPVSAPALSPIRGWGYIPDMNLNLSDEQAALLARELTTIIDNDRFFLAPRIQMLREIRSMIRPDPPRPPLPPIKHYEPPSVGRNRRR
jgi:hypothetical protein